MSANGNGSAQKSCPLVIADSYMEISSAPSLSFGSLGGSDGADVFPIYLMQTDIIRLENRRIILARLMCSLGEIISLRARMSPPPSRANFPA
jgi:hypothetical protein